MGYLLIMCILAVGGDNALLVLRLAIIAAIAKIYISYKCVLRKVEKTGLDFLGKQRKTVI